MASTTVEEVATRERSSWRASVFELFIIVLYIYIYIERERDIGSCV